MGFWANRINELNWGQFVISKIQFIVSLTILLKVFSAPVWLYCVAPVIIFGVTMVVGKIFNKYMRKGYLKAHFKGFKMGD